jgi:RNA 2',3'-cyclic 3'-phosphodiesterase
MARVRTFIAIELAEGIVDRLQELRAKLSADGSEVKWVEESNVHLTLLFLGEVPQLDIVEICNTVRKVTAQHAKFNLELQGVGAFPNRRRPKTLWVGVGEGAEIVQQLHDEIEAALEQLGCYRRENRAFEPHVTLGRVKAGDESDVWGPILSEHEAWSAGTSIVNSVSVMASDTKGTRPVYTVLGKGKLK